MGLEFDAAGKISEGQRLNRSDCKRQGDCIKY